MSELAFIAALRALAVHPGARNFDDDAAVIEIGGEVLVFTHDMMVEGVHFLPGQDPEDVAWKLVATNMSDLAAKGAEPLGVLLGYQLGERDSRFIEGLRGALDYYGAALLGGDTAGANGPQSLGLTAIGTATVRPVPSRSGALPGHGLWLTGSLGAAMLGLEALKSGTGDSLAYRRPKARLAEGLALATQVSAMMDLSDGLLLDASRMAKASGVTFAIKSAAVPIATPEDRRHEALRWGDDYELLFTLPPGIVPFAAATRIGEVQPKGNHPILLDQVPLPPGDLGGFEHG